MGNISRYGSFLFELFYQVKKIGCIALALGHIIRKTVKYDFIKF